MVKIIKKFISKKTLHETIMSLLNKSYFRAIYVNPDMEFQYMAIVKESELADDDSFIVKGGKYYRNKSFDWKLVPRMGKVAMYVEGVSDPISKPIFDVQVERFEETINESIGQMNIMEQKVSPVPTVQIGYMNARKFSERQDFSVMQELKQDSRTALQELKPLLFVIIGVSIGIALKVFEII